MESSEPHIVFDVAKDGFHLCRTSGTQFLSELAGQVFTGLLTVFEQAMADADSAVPLRLGALALEWTIGTIQAFIITPVRDISIVCGVARGVLKMQRLVGRTEKRVGFWLVAEVFRPELVGLDDIRIAVMVRILVESVVLEEILGAMLL